MAPERAPHLWCICVTALHRMVRTRESHALSWGPRREPNATKNFAGFAVRRSSVQTAPTESERENPAIETARPHGVRLRRHTARRAVDVKVERPQRSKDET
jgi:hypothetical protein